MSLRPMPWPEVPEQTAVVARAAFPRGSLPMRLRDELGPIFLDTDFKGTFGVRGRGRDGGLVGGLARGRGAVARDCRAATVDLQLGGKRYGPRACDLNWPRAKAERDALAEEFGRDGRDLVTALFAQRQRPWLR